MLQVGLDSKGILIGDELEHITDPALGQLAEQIEVFARISPIQKQRIISALRSHGHVVGYIGNGINDVPSLHTSDVGISVAGAVDVAREAADIILLKRHLCVLLNGIIEGRKSLINIKRLKADFYRPFIEFFFFNLNFLYLGFFSFWNNDLQYTILVFALIFDESAAFGRRTKR